MNETPTPKTDAAAIYAPIQGMIICVEGTGSYVKADFARDLERELAECSRQLEAANKDARGLHETLMQLASEPHAPWSATATAMFESATGAHKARVQGGLPAAPKVKQP